MSDRQKRMFAGLAAGLFIACVLHSVTRIPGSFLTELVQGYEYRSYDSRMKARAAFSEEGSIDDVIIIDIELSSIESMGNYYDWPHAYHGQLIDVVSSGKPLALLFDIIFDPKSSDTYDLVQTLVSNQAGPALELKQAADQFLITHATSRLVASTAQSSVIHHTLVLEHPDTANFLYAMDGLPGDYAAAGHTLDLPQDAAERLPAAERIGNIHFDLLNASQGIGTPNFPPDNDGIIRRAPTAIYFTGSKDVFPSITLSAAMDILGIPADGLHYDFENNILRLKDSNGTVVREIPIDDKGRMYVHYYGPFKTFSYIPYLYCFDPEMLDPSYWEGKIAIVGSSLAGLGDLKSTAVQESFAGPEIHANVIHSILKNEFVTPVSKSQHLWGLILISCLVGILSGVPNRPFWGFGVLIFGAGAWVVFATSQFLSSGIMWDVVRPITSIALTQLSVFSFTFLIMDRDKRFLRDTFGTYISPKLIEQMVEQKEGPKLGGDEAIHTAFFTDIQSFSVFSEKMSATDLVELLNSYLTDMTTILLENQGTLDKYIGDAIVAFFGAPMPVKEHEYWACVTALKMQARLDPLRQKWEDEGDRWPEEIHFLQNRIGIHTGPMVTGNMGSTHRMNYTMMGDTVNIAARLESSAKQYGVYTHISEDTYSAVKDQMTVRELDKVIVMGRSDSVQTYELIAEKGQEPDLYKELVPRFHDALELYKKQQWDQAFTAFESLEKMEDMFPGRKTNPSRVYLDRCTHLKENPPGEDWDGVWTLTSK